VAFVEAPQPLLVDQPAAVIGHDQAGGTAIQPERELGAARVGMLHTVAQELTRRTEQQPIDRSPKAIRPVVDINLDGKVRSGRRLGKVLKGTGQAGMLEHSGVQLGHGRAQHPRRLDECVLNAVDGTVGSPLPEVVEVEARCQHVLQDRPTQAVPTLASMKVRMAIESHGSSLAACAATLATR
jgi:hypothetical protein